jgi:hypothetical protein
MGGVMRANRWVSLLALFGVLLHAGLLVRHNNIVLAAVQQQDLLFSYGIICEVPADSRSDGQPQNQPSPFKKLYKCPICLGAVPGASLAGLLVLNIEPPASFVLPLKAAVTVAAVIPQFRAVHPPSRAPPATV